MSKHIIPIQVDADAEVDRESFEDWLFDLIQTAVSNPIPGFVALGFIEDDAGEDVPVTIRVGDGVIKPRGN